MKKVIPIINILKNKMPSVILVICCMYVHRYFLWSIAVLNLDWTVVEGRHVFLFQRWLLFSGLYFFVGIEGLRSLERVVGGLIQYVLLKWVSGNVFFIIMCIITYCCFAPNIFVRVQIQPPLVLRVGGINWSGDRGRGPWISGRYWRWFFLGCRWISGGPGSWYFVWGIVYPKLVTNRHWLPTYIICIF